ncbi:MAG: hypothetical protein K0Q43_4777 [Ramlibacter sp.]|jgi:hypothetical protein|nr:hypothetical protein [Ramlibacter sp.]
MGLRSQSHGGGSHRMDEETAFPVGGMRLPGLEQNVPAITVMSEPDTTFHAFGARGTDR